MTAAACPHIKPLSALDWPSTPLETTTVLCGGDSFLDYCLRRKALRNIRHGSSFLSLGSSCSSEEEEEAVERQRDLFSLSSKQLQKLTYYQVLEIPTHSSPHVIKKGYHAACLLYHPDKTGRNEDDEVFLKVKAAFDTLSDSDKRKAYDSSELTFDDSIPQGGESASDFYEIYGPVFERNLMFDARLRENGKHKAPLLGKDDTPIDKVHAFYEYWIHFDSWRDFSLKASIETENDLESADSRFEKRWMQKEIAKKSKAYKREEMARLNLLVERAMSADPRLKREKLRLQQEKQARQEAKKKKEEEEKQKQLEEQERSQAERAKQDEEEKASKASARAIREKEKKQLRKSRQSFRKLTMEAVEAQNMLSSLEEINDDIELLCDKLTAQQLSRLTETLTSHNNVLEAVKVHARQTRKGVSEEEIEALHQRDAAREEEERKARLARQRRAMAPWTKQELSALAKAVKKYPPGGANRWEAIALFINNVCKPQDPRSKEECIEKYNQIAVTMNKQQEIKQPSGGDNVWTDEQDAQLQKGLKSFPATMDKNERWASIAEGVDGKSKKECVERFKAIRTAIKNK
jgi:DnaJ family protein C protein 2